MVPSVDAIATQSAAGRAGAFFVQGKSSAFFVRGSGANPPITHTAKAFSHRATSAKSAYHLCGEFSPV
ncbi:MAG: hypothetical protein ACUZ8N_01305 [Candidatus Scalindua sp.]